MSAPDPYRARLWQLTLVQLAGVAVAFAGMVLGATDKLGPRQPVPGFVLVAVGLFGSMAVARWLRRRWGRQPRE